MAGPVPDPPGGIRTRPGGHGTSTVAATGRDHAQQPIREWHGDGHVYRVERLVHGDVRRGDPPSRALLDGMRAPARTHGGVRLVAWFDG